MRRASLTIVASISVTAGAHGQITVPPNREVDVLLNQIDGRTPRLEAIRNAAYGSGVVAASVDNGVLTVLRIAEDEIDVLASRGGFAPGSASRVVDVQFDTSGIFGGGLYVTVAERDDPPPGQRTTLLEIAADGTVAEHWTVGGGSDWTSFRFALTDGSGGYTPGGYLFDGNISGGTEFWYMTPPSPIVPSRISGNHVPPGRVDIDSVALQFDPNGNFDHSLLLADADDHDQICGIYAIKPNYGFTPVTDFVPLSERDYEDMEICRGGNFKPTPYLTDKVSQTIMWINDDFEHEHYAGGFTGIYSITFDTPGDYMYVSDSNGVYRIREASAPPGPRIIMQSPRTDVVHCDPAGIDALRLLFNEDVLFADMDVRVLDGSGVDVPFSVSGSNSSFMVISFGETLLDDTYTIEVHDTVMSVSTGRAFDGDDDGAAGGDASLTLRHMSVQSCPGDTDGDQDVDFADLEELLDHWGESCL